MRIVALQSSARKGGNTERIVRLIEESLRRRSRREGFPLEFEYVALADRNLSLCRGCRVCFDRGEAHCPLKDDLPGLYKKLLDADGAIFASPVYVEDVTAGMKNFIDRMAFNCHRPAFAGKTALIVTTSGAESSGRAARTLEFALGSWGFHIAGDRKFRMGALMAEADAADKFGRDADRLAEKLSRAIADKKALTPSFYSLMIFRVQQSIYRSAPQFKGTYDRAQWEQNGWLDKKRAFYIPHRANPVKTAAARAAGAVLAKLFK
ncbi:NADPH-dependent FMN reductase [Sporobacter termitidis DSM 10068]|uniref:NADPH-dependent FMN reductase n=1 Tax=Sporobacter termitidis DSM 10068 TaxID=1123282 RepID=A0A1M5YEJ4_9FIRM|nr:NAD(P)H-dependent oxidoreductase [Sporobacter termitidis]SHI10481.1 NADPH-dependent FMN reductase [Sporobacter termitidis DSM 10068]